MHALIGLRRPHVRARRLGDGSERLPVLRCLYAPCASSGSADEVRRRRAQPVRGWCKPSAQRPRGSGFARGPHGRRDRVCRSWASLGSTSGAAFEGPGQSRASPSRPQSRLDSTLAPRMVVCLWVNLGRSAKALGVRVNARGLLFASFLLASCEAEPVSSLDGGPSDGPVATGEACALNAPCQRGLCVLEREAERNVSCEMRVMGECWIGVGPPACLCAVGHIESPEEELPAIWCFD